MRSQNLWSHLASKLEAMNEEHWICQIQARQARRLEMSCSNPFLQKTKQELKVELKKGSSSSNEAQELLVVGHLFLFHGAWMRQARRLEMWIYAEQLQVNQTKYFNVHNEIYLLESTSIVMQKKGSKCLRFLLCTTLEQGKPEACAKPLLWSWLDINLIDSTNESFKKNAHRPVQIDPLLKQHYCSLEPRRSRARNIDEDSIRKKYVQPSINVSVNATTSHQLSMKGVSKAGR